MSFYLESYFYSLMADECTNIATVEELSVFFRGVEDGEPVEHFFDIIPLKKADAESIYSTLIDWLKQEDIQLTKLVGMGFDEAATFAGKRTGVQARLKKNSPHLSMCIATVTCCNWPVFKLLTTLQELNMFTKH